MNVSNEYEDDDEASDFDMIHFDETHDEETPTPTTQDTHLVFTKKKSLTKKKRRLEDWLEEKRLRDALHEDSLDT